MNPFAYLDSAFAEQFGGLPQIEPPVPLAPELPIIPMKEISMEEFAAMYPPNADGMEVQEVYMGHLLLGNADIAINNRESVEGICVEDEHE